MAHGSSDGRPGIQLAQPGAANLAGSGDQAGTRIVVEDGPDKEARGEKGRGQARRPSEKKYA